MARKMTEWPSKRRPLTKIRPSDGCKGDGVPLAVDQWYDFPEFGCHLGNVGQLGGEFSRRAAVRRQNQRARTIPAEPPRVLNIRSLTDG